VIHLPIKAAVGRSRPRGAAVLGTQRSTSSFPSGHTASDLSFVLGAAQEVPGLMVLSVATLASHWSLIRSRIHYPSDVLGGGVIAVVVAAGAWKLQPPRSSRRGEPPNHLPPSAGVPRHPPHAAWRAAMRFVVRRSRRAMYRR
jgi:membrane-associated phospholipid phosphatase